MAVREYEDDSQDDTGKPFDAVGNVFEKARQRGSRTTLDNREEADFAQAIYGRRPEYREQLARYKRERASQRAAEGVRRVRSGNMGSSS